MANAPSGNIFGWTQDADMGWNPNDLGKDEYLILSIQGDVRLSDGSPIALGYHPVPGGCTEVASLGPTYVVKMDGDLVGCHYVFVTSSRCSPSGTYVEEGNEYFVSATNLHDTFRTRYKFEAKYRDCSTATGEIIGRCQHPIIAGSGKGILEGVTGRLDFKDDVKSAAYPLEADQQRNRCARHPKILQCSFVPARQALQYRSKLMIGF